MSAQNTQDPQTSVLESKLQTNRKYYVFMVVYLVILSALGSFVNDMFSPAMPSMCKFFGCSIPMVQLGLTTGMIGLAVGQFFLGPLSDHYGRMPVLVISLIIFIAAATVSIFSPTIHFFVVTRFFQGLGASGAYFLAKTIPADVSTGRDLAKLMALIGAINGFAPASAPVLGGVIADAWTWKGIFVVLVIFAIFVLLMAKFMKESLAPARRTPGKWWQGIKGYLNLIKNRAFMTHTIYKSVALGFLFAYISSSPFILENHYGFSQTMYGVVIGVNSLFAAAGSMIALKFKVFQKAARVGAYILLISVMAQAVALWFVHSFWLFESLMVLIIFALGLIFSVSNTLAMNEGRNQAGEASALLGIGGYIVGALASPLVGIGNVLHSTAIAYVVLGILVFVASTMSNRLAPDLNS